MRRFLTPLLALVVSALVSSSVALASNQYALDDGLPNSGLSYGLPTDYVWFQSFTTVGATDSLTSIQIMWQPGMIPPGTTVKLCVWEDPNNDYDPADAILVTQQVALVPNVTSYAYTNYPIAPSLVHGVFFIGAVLTTDGNMGTLSLLDYNSGLSGRAWFATDAPGFFDPTQLSSSFYNHIEILGAGIHGVFMLRAEGSGNAPTLYCTGKPNSMGCQPQLSFVGTPSVSAGSGFHVYASNVINRAPGMFVYGTNGRATTPFHGGTLCFAAPVRRTPAQNSGGSQVGVDCTGNYHFDFAAWVASGGDPSLVAGTTVNAQFYSRDNGFAAPDNIGLTNAVEFTLVP